MVNPFLFGKVVKDKNFCNRTQEINYIKSLIRSGNSLWLYSPRRFGKTSLILKTFSEIDEIKTIYFDIFQIRDSKEFAVKYLNVLTQELFTWKQGVSSVLKKISHHLKNVTPTVSLDQWGNPTVGVDIKPNKLKQTIESILSLPQELKYKQKICIAFDEFQEIERIDPFLKNLMRSIFQHQQNINYIFLGSKESLMNEIFSDPKSPFFQFGDKMSIDKISREDLSAYIKKMFRETKLIIKDDTIAEILKVSECHPHYTQYIAFIVWNLIYEEVPQNTNFTNLWLARTIESQSDMLRTIFDQLNTNQRKILYALSDINGESILANDTRLKYDLPPKSTIITALKSLLHKSLILKAGNEYSFENPIFKIWINQLYDE